MSVSGFCILLKNVQSIFQRMIQYSAYYYKKCPGYYSESGSRFSSLFKNVQGNILRLVQYSAYHSKTARVLFGVWFSIQHVNMLKVSAYAVKTGVYATCSVFFGNCYNS